LGFRSALSLLWIVPVAGVIVAVYILKLRRRDVVVSSTYLWSQVIRDVQANAPFQKLRRNLLLILQLIAAALLVAAIAQPFRRQMGLGGRSIALVVDVSASMGATDARPNRLAVAKDTALRLVGKMRPGDQMLVISAASRPETVTPFTSDRGELRRAIDALCVKDTGTDMRASLALAAALVASREESRIDVISDGGFAPISGIDFGKARLAFHEIGQRADNVGIVAADYRRIGGSSPRVEGVITLRGCRRQ
jgi:Ca-activated chloride channel homolog